MKEAKRVAVNTGFLYGRMAITVFISLYATRLILNALGAEDFGLFNVVGGAIAMLTFLNNAMATATQRFMSFAQGEGDFEKQKQIFNVSLLLHIAIAFIIYLLLQLAGFFLFDDILKISPARLVVAKQIYQFLIISTFFTILAVPYDAIINAHENMLFVAILGIIEALVKLGIAIYVVKTDFDKLFSYGLLMAILSVFLLVVRLIYCHNKYDEVKVNLRRYFSKPLFREITGFASWSLLGCSTSMIGNYGQGIILNVFFGTLVNAAQGIANQISGQLGAFSSTMLKALNPLIAKSEGAGNRNLMLEASMLGAKVSFFLLMIFIAPVLIEMRFILQIWLKNVPDYATIFCSLLLIRNLIDQFSVTLSSAIGAVGNIKKTQLITSIIYILPLSITYLLFYNGLPAWVLYITFLIFSVILVLVTITFAKINCGLPVVRYFTKVIAPCVISLLIVICISSIPFFIMNQGLTRLFFVTLSSIITSLSAIWLIGLNSTERLKFKLIVNGITKRNAFQ